MFQAYTWHDMLRYDSTNLRRNSCVEAITSSILHVASPLMFAQLLVATVHATTLMIRGSHVEDTVLYHQSCV